MDPKTSPQIADLAAALAAFQAEVSDPEKTQTARIEPKDKSKPAFSYGYADLAGVLQHVRPLLAKNGLSVVQDAVCASDHVEVTTLLMHSSGQYMTFGPLSMPAGGEPKSWGSAITYARRFALMAALGVAASGDDDAKAAARGATRGRPRKATDNQIRKIGFECDRGHITDEELSNVLKRYEGKPVAELTTAEASDLIERLIAEADRRAAAESAGADPVTGEVPPDDDAIGFDEGPPGMDADEYRESRSGAEPTPQGGGLC